MECWQCGPVIRKCHIFPGAPGFSVGPDSYHTLPKTNIAPENQSLED